MDLAFSILSSSLIFIIFKLFPRWNVDTFQAVIANYFVAFSCGLLLFNNYIPNGNQIIEIIPLTSICGFLFISLFIIMGLSAQINGVANTSVSVKMSLALSVILVMISTQQTIGFLTLLPLFLAIFGVFLVSFSKEKTTLRSETWMLVVLFIGSAGLDLVLYASKAWWLPKGLHDGIFASFGFGLAGILGLSYLLIKRFRQELSLDLKSWLAGILLGIPNYFSIYLLVKSYKSIDLKPQQILAIANVGVVVLSALLGLFVFRESFSNRKVIGLVLCLLSLILFIRLV